jgi:hypothetical protein
MLTSGSLFSDLPEAPLADERLQQLYSAQGVRIERIRSGLLRPILFAIAFGIDM